MPLPRLNDWNTTRRNLHQALQVLRAARLLGVDRLPNYLHLATWSTRSGASTGPLSFGGELKLNYADAAIIYAQNDGEIFRVHLDGHHQTSLFDAVFAAFRQAGQDLEPDRSKIVETTPFDLDLDDASAYAETQFRLYRVLAEVKAHMFGPQTPLVLWPHGFDLSTLWFIDGMVEAEDPHINFGFSPGTPDVGQPYFYFYASPPLAGLQEKMPSLVSWHTSWHAPGGAIGYEHFARLADPEAMLADLLVDMYRLISIALKAQSA